MKGARLTLDERTRLRFVRDVGLSQRVMNDGKEMTLDEIAFVLGISVQRVKQIEKRALEKLRGLGLRIEDFI